MTIFIGVFIPLFILFVMPFVQLAWTPLIGKIKVAIGNAPILTVFRDTTTEDAEQLPEDEFSYVVQDAVPTYAPPDVQLVMPVQVTPQVTGTITNGVPAMLPTVTILPTPTPDIRTWYYAQFEAARGNQDMQLAKTLAMELQTQLPGEPVAASILDEIARDEEFVATLSTIPDKSIFISNLLSGRTFTIVSVEAKTWQSVWSEKAVLSVVGGWLDGHKITIYRGHLNQLGYSAGQTTLIVP